MRHEPEGRPAEASDQDGRPEAESTGTGAAAPTMRTRGLFPLSIRNSLIVVMLVPLVVAVALASSAVASQLSSRHQAVAIRNSSITLDSLLRARTEVYAEFVPSQALITARDYHVTPAALDALLGVNVHAELLAARRALDGQGIFGPGRALHRQYVQLVRMRQAIDRSQATPAEVTALYLGLDSVIDQRWQATYNSVVAESNLSDAPATRQRLNALGASFSAFTAGVNEDTLPAGGSLEAVLTATPTPAQVESLIANRQSFLGYTSSFPGSLGPEGAAAWNALTHDTLTRQFAGDVQTAITVGLYHLPPPAANNSTDAITIGGIARSEVAWANALARLVLGASADLRTAATQQATSASTSLLLASVLMVVVLLLAIGAVLALSRRVRRPLDRIVAAATSIREGELDFPPLDESGPKELATAASAFNEMAATLQAVQGQAIALSRGDLDNPVLLHQLPGRTGAALQSALDQLHLSVKSSERERAALFERATRDSLTGLLNRGAALEALEIDLASVRRSQGAQALTLFFIDLDDLKAINDSAGHDSGDAAIRAVAEALMASTRGSDVAARFGGDEFVVGLLGSRDSPIPAGLADRISAHVAGSHIGHNGRSVHLSCSIGVAVSEPTDTAIGMLIERADQALYDAKAHGKGQIRWFSQIDVDPGDVLVARPGGR